MKKIIAIVAFVGILLQTFTQVITVVQYYANKDFIAKNLCENRNKPTLHCDGKCCLKKKLAKESKEQAPSSSNSKGEVSVTLFYSNDHVEIVKGLVFKEIHCFFSKNDLRTFAFHNTVFHPPAA